MKRPRFVPTSRTCVPGANVVTLDMTFPFTTVDAQKSRCSSPGDRGQDVDDGARRQRRVEPLQVAHVRPIDVDVDEWPQLARLQAEAEAQARTPLLELGDNVAQRRARYLRTLAVSILAIPPPEWRRLVL